MISMLMPIPAVPQALDNLEAFADSLPKRLHEHAGLPDEQLQQLMLHSLQQHVLTDLCHSMRETLGKILRRVVQLWDVSAASLRAERRCSFAAAADVRRCARRDCQARGRRLRSAGAFRSLRLRLRRVAAQIPASSQSRDVCIGGRIKLVGIGEDDSREHPIAQRLEVEVAIADCETLLATLETLLAT
jgi:hypothetical protein